MMSYYPTQSDINILFQPSKHIYSKVEILNRNYMVIATIEGDLLSDGFNIDSVSNIRRTYSCELHVTDSSFNIGSNKKIWFDKFIRPYVGIYSLREKKIIWYLKGTFANATANYTYNTSTNTLSLSCNDLMCMLTGDMDGIQTALNFKIPVGEDIRTSIIGILNVFGFTKYRIEDLPRNVQFDLEFGTAATAYEMIGALMELCPNFEFFFDIDGTFIVQRISCYINDADIFDESILSNLVTSEDNYTVNFTARNCIEIWGKSYSDDSISSFTDKCTYVNNIYMATFESMTTLDDYMILGIKVPAVNQANFSVNLNNLKTLTVIDDYERNIKADSLEADASYLFMYVNAKLYFLGQFEIHAQYKNELATSRFSIDNVGRELWDVFSGDDYENITSDTLAKERAMYECYYKSNLNESLSLTLIDIPWLDVNQKVSYTLKSTGENYRWMINSISGDTLSGQCSVGLSRFYPDWSEIFQQEYI